MQINSFINKIVKVVLNPSQNWDKYTFDNKDFKYDFRIVFIFTLSLVFLSRLIGKTLLYLPSSSIEYIILYAVLSFAVDIIGFFIVVYILRKILPYYNVEVNKNDIKILIFASLIPYYISIIILNLFSSVYFLAIVGVYGFYVLYCGINKFIKVSQKNSIIFFIIASLIIVGIFLILHFIIIFPFFEFIS